MITGNGSSLQRLCLPSLLSLLLTLLFFFLFYFFFLAAFLAGIKKAEEELRSGSPAAAAQSPPVVALCRVFLFYRHQNLVFQRSLTLYLKATIKGCQGCSFSCVRPAIFLSFVPLLVNLLFGLLGLGVGGGGGLMRLHAGSAQELLSADGTRGENVLN